MPWSRKCTNERIQTFWKKSKSLYFASEKMWESCSFDWEMVGDEDLKSWEFAYLQSVGTLITLSQ